MTALVVFNGDVDREFLVSQLLVSDLVVAADGAVRAILDAGGSCDVLVGDMDSLDQIDLTELRAVNPELDVRMFPSEKDATDGELALRAALESDPDRIGVVGAFGGNRLDHEFANISLLANEDWRDRDVVLVDPTRRVSLLTNRTEINGVAGDVITLIPFGGGVTGISSEGLRYELNNRDLVVGTSLGVSNELLATSAVVTVATGMLLVVHEGQRATD